MIGEQGAGAGQTAGPMQPDFSRGKTRHAVPFTERPEARRKRSRFRNRDGKTLRRDRFGRGEAMGDEGEPPGPELPPCSSASRSRPGRIPLWSLRRPFSGPAEPPLAISGAGYWNNRFV
jgi:hypothetical protein